MARSKKNDSDWFVWILIFALIVLILIGMGVIII